MYVNIYLEKHNTYCWEAERIRKQMKKEMSKKKKAIIFIIIMVVLLVGVVGGLYLYSADQAAKDAALEKAVERDMATKEDEPYITYDESTYLGDTGTGENLYFDDYNSKYLYSGYGDSNWVSASKKLNIPFVQNINCPLWAFSKADWDKYIAADKRKTECIKYAHEFIRTLTDSRRGWEWEGCCYPYAFKKSISKTDFEDKYYEKYSSDNFLADGGLELEITNDRIVKMVSCGGSYPVVKVEIEADVKCIKKPEMFKDSWIPKKGKTKKIYFQVSCHGGMGYEFYPGELRVKGYNDENDPMTD